MCLRVSTSSGEAGTGRVSLAPRCFPDRGQKGPSLSVVHHHAAIDRFRDDRPSQLQLFERIVRQQLKLHGVLEGAEGAARRRATVGAAAGVPSSFTLITSMARRTVAGEAKLRSGSDRLAIHATSLAISLGTSACSMGR